MQGLALELVLDQAFSPHLQECWSRKEKSELRRKTIISLLDGAPPVALLSLIVIDGDKQGADCCGSGRGGRDWTRIDN
jgi:hypothetical protein